MRKQLAEEEQHIVSATCFSVTFSQDINRQMIAAGRGRGAHTAAD
jgi:hypothetical protein